MHLLPRCPSSTSISTSTSTSTSTGPSTRTNTSSSTSTRTRTPTSTSTSIIPSTSPGISTVTTIAPLPRFPPPPCPTTKSSLAVLRQECIAHAPASPLLYKRDRWPNRPPSRAVASAALRVNARPAAQTINQSKIIWLAPTLTHTYMYIRVIRTVKPEVVRSRAQL